MKVICEKANSGNANCAYCPCGKEHEPGEFCNEPVKLEYCEANCIEVNVSPDNQ